MVAIRLRSPKLDPNYDVTEEVKRDITPGELADLAKEKLDCFDQRTPVKIFLDTGEEFTGVVTEGQVLYAVQDQEKEEENTESVIRLCVLGPGAVGKSAICTRFTQDHFHEDYDPTIEDAYRKRVKIDGRIAMLDILDTAGQEDFSALRAVWYRNKNGFLLVYAINNPTSLSELNKLYEELTQHYEGEVMPPILLVGNKSDLADNSSEELWETAEELALQWKTVEHMKTSAKTAHNVKAAFANIVRATRVKTDEPSVSQCCSIL